MAEIVTRGNTLIIRRIFDAPREQLWEAWTRPRQLKKWWGPKFFTCPFSEIDLREGGKYLHCMQGPDGKRYWSTGKYLKIIPGEKLIATDSFSDENGHIVSSTYYGMGDKFPMVLKVTVMFEDYGSGTMLTLQHEGLPVGEMKDQTGAGWDESFDKLAHIQASD